MKAQELKKQSITIEKIYDEIQELNKNNPEINKKFIPHFVYVSESVKEKLMQDGFDLTIGDWDGQMKNCLIIKW